MNLKNQCVDVKHSHFTLIELLVVIAIIAILAAILLPALQQARDRGAAANCTGNQKQMGVVLLQYADSYDGRWPSGSGSSYFWYGLRAWFPNYKIEKTGTPSISDKNHAGQRLGKEQERINAPLFFCPSRKKMKSDSIGITYYVPPSWSQHFGGIPRIKRAYRPSLKFMLIEHHSNGDGQAVTLPRYSTNAAVHAKKNNILHIDGHVEPRELLPPYFQIQSGGNHKKFHYHWKPECKNKNIFTNKDCTGC